MGLLPPATQLGVEGGHAGGVLVTVGNELLLCGEEAELVIQNLEVGGEAFFEALFGKLDAFLIGGYGFLLLGDDFAEFLTLYESG